ncbi:MAG: lysophospholipid acyltransferase family protein [Acidobacteriota bacterium]|jgi:putative hemolysin|nr:lysophospholipid acyltransferase family protein [Acidobacteriota bacterium]
MQLLNVREMIEAKQPDFFKKYPRLISRLIVRFLHWLLHIEEANEFIRRHSDKKNFEFIDEIFEFLDFSYLLTSRDRQRIPSEGKLVIVSNHPLGALDGLAILKAVGEIRSDVKVVVNDVLAGIDQLADLFLPYNIFSPQAQRQRVGQIMHAFANEEAVLFFPSAEVSRLKAGRVMDGYWYNGPVYFAQKYEVPILPIYVKSRNSIWFYLISFLHKKFSMFLLPREVFKKRGKNLRLKIGDPIPGRYLKQSPIHPNLLTKMLKKHVYKLARKSRPQVFKTEKTILHPISKPVLKQELMQSLLLDTPEEHLRLFQVDYQTAPNVVKEIARLREMTFRRVDEGTGGRIDMDEYDQFYVHLVLWNEQTLEIVGAYRLVRVADVLQRFHRHHIYTASLFKYAGRFQAVLEQSAELGRSFIQYRYWNTRALDYLWRGIGLYVSQFKDLRYLLGAVSISHSFSSTAKSLIVYYYRKWYGDKENLVRAKSPYIISREQLAEMESVFRGDSAESDFPVLKQTLKTLGYAVPVLFRQYIQQCLPGGVRFMDFCVDLDFNTVDGLLVMDMALMDPRKKERYKITGAATIAAEETELKS